MQQCEFCGSELPNYAHFCGYCGRVNDNLTARAGNVTRASDVGILTQDAPTTPPFFSGSSYPLYGNIQGQEDAQTTLANRWTDAQNTLIIGPVEENRRLPPFLPFPGNGQAPGGHVPLVHGTPPAARVPSVQGTPHAPVNPPAGQVAFQNQAASAPYNGAQAPSWVRNDPPQPAQHVKAGQPVHHPHTSPITGHHPHHKHVKEHDSQPLHDLSKHHHHTARTHTPRTHHGAKKLALNTPAKWVILVITAIVVIVSVGIGFVLATPPGLSLSGSSSVAVGSILHVHGRGFIPGGSVTFTLDKGIPVSPVVQSAATTRAAQNLPNTGMGFAEKLDNAEFAHASGNATSIGATGTFDANIIAANNWLPGIHTIHATEQTGSRSADLKFTVLGVSAKLGVNPSSLDFGAVEMGGRAVMAVAVSNQGGQLLHWSADTGSTLWLKLQSSAGAIGVSGVQEFIYVGADTTHLKMGSYTAILQIHSNGGDAQVAVSMRVVAQSLKKLARLDVTPSSLNFGHLLVGQRVTQTVAIGNLGTMGLNWQADTGTTPWLSLNIKSGSVKAGTTPQTLQVMVDTGSLQPASYNATLTINSNGGSTRVPIMLVVLSKQPGSPAANPPVLTGGPNSFSVPGDPNCNYDVTSGWTCTAILGSYRSAQSDLRWTASGTGVNGITFNPANGTLTPGQIVPVSIFIPNTACPAAADFTFRGQANTVDIPWHCTAPTLSTSKSSMNANTDCAFTHGWTCNIAVSIPENAQGLLRWSASGGLKGTGFSPSGGILSPGQPVQVTITIPNTSCPNSANWSFSGQGQGANPVVVQWSCGTPSLVVSPTSYSIPDNNCTYSAGQGWTCMTMLSLKSPGDPSAGWSTFASVGGCCNVQFSPSSGTLTPGQPVQVAITVSDTVCPVNLTLGFLLTGGNTVSVPWSCGAPALSVSIASLSSTSCQPSRKDGGWICNEAVSEAGSAQGDLNWSASSDLSGVVFIPSKKGPLAPGGSTTVSINIPANDCMNGTFTFSGGAQPVNVSWSCQASLQ
ncbi:MAG TPA: hypothetical protein VF043_27765 [Ktedonobacteraceae bacterium]